MSRWGEVWAQRGGEGADSLEALIRLDGFDQGAGKVDAGPWLRYCAELKRRLGVAPGDSVFEVGCGAGALLYVFHREGHEVGGIDFAPALLEAAQRMMPGKAFTAGAAADLNAPARDFVLANSVFSYFPDLDYARRVADRMLGMARKGVAILDVPDLARREASEAYRRGALPAGEYEKRYEGLAHLYYGRDWFHALGAGKWRVEIADQWMESYGNAPFRFNVLMTRNGSA